MEGHRLYEHFSDAHDAISPAVATTAVARMMIVMGVAIKAAAAKAAPGAGATSHAHGVADEAKRVARGGARGHAQPALNGRRHAQAEAGEEGGQGAAGDEGHDDHEEDLDGVALGPVDEVAEEALELLV